MSRRDGKKTERSGNTERSERVVISGVWKGENESDPELVDSYSNNPLSDAGAWTEEEACSLYREKLVRLRDLYIEQLSHLRHSMRERKRQTMLEWQGEGRRMEQVSQPSHGNSSEDTAYSRYCKLSGEEALVQRKQKQRRVAVSLDVYSRKDVRETNRSHYQHLARLHQQVGPLVPTVCATQGCDHHCMPFASRCPRHICEEPKQCLYTRCAFGGGRCTNIIPQYSDPPLCGGHCDTIDMDVGTKEDSGGAEERGGEVGRDGGGGEEREGGERGGGGGARGLGSARERAVEGEGPKGKGEMSKDNGVSDGVANDGAMEAESSLNCEEEVGGGIQPRRDHDIGTVPESSAEAN